METGNNQSIIEVERLFEVDVETLFNAWTGQEHLMAWWHPMGLNLTRVECELREGGAVTYYVGEEGLEVTGVYKEVIPNKKLVYSWIWNMNDEGSADGYTLHIDFAPEGEGKSRLHVLQEGFSAPEFVEPHQQGWDKGLDDLEAYLSNRGR